MDIENLEFRPLTGGLGFDKTTETKKSGFSVNAPKPPPRKTSTLKLEDTVETSEPAAPVSRSLKKMLPGDCTLYRPRFRPSCF